ncbi:MAG: hypothetical protein IJ667_09345 [Synergistaceae bacterium]|nr:hypothetical protein [Synergistaceae bacterium]
MSGKLFRIIVLISCLAFAHSAYSEPITLETQGSFMIGGSTVKNDGEFIANDWLSQSGQTAYEAHIKENFDILDFSLTAGEMAQIAALEQNPRNSSY